MKVFVDLDHTLCIPDDSQTQSIPKYANAAPIQGIINRVNQLRLDGHHITIYTARRMKTHQGDVEKVIADVGELTRNWLKEHKVSYDELIFGKPYYDLLIDDKTFNPSDNWSTVKNLLHDKNAKNCFGSRCGV